MKIFRKGNLSEADIFQWLKELRPHAYVPESGFAVTSVFRARAGEVDDYYFSGVNVENADHRLSTHGEEACIAAMTTGLGRDVEIVEGWVMGASQKDSTSDSMAVCCGKCRQQIAGFAGQSVKIHTLSLNGKKQSTTVGDFLPAAFNFQAYLPEVVGIQKISTNVVSVADIGNKLIRKGNLSDEKIFNWLGQLESVDYVSKISQAMVLQLDNGAYAAGVKVEEAAFVDISAAQSALAVAVSEFGVRKIQGVWVYTKGSARNHHGLTLSTLQIVAPLATRSDIPVHLYTADGAVITTPLSSIR